ncbi:MAG: helix-turn-helix domain-containing protein [Chloroflexota bacterium]|nr:helix-turn-helix domain-containing protein [Chloroflexota bacterium]
MSDHSLGQATDQVTTHTITDAARLLGVSENAVRKRIRRGTLPAQKQGDRWLVAFPGQAADYSSATIDLASPTSGLAGGQAAPTTGQASDLAAAITPLADLIERLTRENRELAEAATTWQMRAGILEQQLKQLTAGGDTPTDAPQASPFAPGEAQPANVAPDPSASPRPAHAPWWRRWLGLDR